MRTILLDLPCTVRGFVTEVEDEEIIVLNSRLNREANVKTYIHELKHISQSDLYKECNIDVLEYFRHKEGTKCKEL